MNDFYLPEETIDDYEFPIYQIFWVLDDENACKIRPFIEIEGTKSIGFLDNLSKDIKPKSETVISTDMFLELLYRLTTSERQRELLIDYDTRITTEYKLYREEMLEMADLYEKFAKKYAAHQETQNKMFSINPIEKRQDLLSRITFENEHIFWHVQNDDSTIVKPFLELKNDMIGYLDNCEIANIPEKKDILTSQQLADLFMLILSANQRREKLIEQIYNQLTLPERLSQKTLARISQIYHETASKYAGKQIIINDSFHKFEA